MSGRPADPLAQLVEAVQASARYRQISPELVRRIGRRELAIRGNLKEAVKATKNTLHQICGAFFTAPPRYDEWLADLHDAVDSRRPAALRAACLRIMVHHASTRERLTLLESFYATVLESIPPIRTVLDVACGLNPLAIPWMGLAPDVVYHCYDIDAALVGFLNSCFALLGIQGLAEVRDVLAEPPQQAGDLVLLLKALPTLEALDRAACLALLHTLPANYLLISFPGRTLGGRHKGLAGQHEARLVALAQAERWTLRRFPFPAEPAFLVHRQDQNHQPALSEQAL